MRMEWWRIGTYLPEQVLSNADLYKECHDFSEEYSRVKLGIETRHIAGEETCVDMACKAVEDLKNQGVQIDDTDLLLVVTQTPDYPLPSMSCILQDRLALKQEIKCFDINMGCSGYIYALSTVYAYIKSGLASKAIIITSERYSRHLRKEDYQNRAIFGDAATATLLTQEMTEHFKSFIFQTDGMGYDAIIVPDEKTGFVMDGSKVMAFAIKQIPRVVKKLLEETGLEEDDINHYIFHQGNRYMIKTIQNRLHIPDEKMVCALKNIGNTVSSSIPMALYSLVDDNVMDQGSKLLLCGFGVGLSVAGLIVEC